MLPLAQALLPLLFLVVVALRVASAVSFFFAEATCGRACCCRRRCHRYCLCTCMRHCSSMPATLVAAAASAAAAAPPPPVSAFLLFTSSCHAIHHCPRPTMPVHATQAATAALRLYRKKLAHRQYLGAREHRALGDIKVQRGPKRNVRVAPIRLRSPTHALHLENNMRATILPLDRNCGVLHLRFATLHHPPPHPPHTPRHPQLR